MTLELVRVDDRLIHGQVVVGWGHALRPDIVVLVDDDIAGSEWEKELYRMGVPEDMDIKFLTVEEGASEMESLANSQERAIVVLSSVAALLKMCFKTSAVRKVNLGGVHYQADRRERLPYVFLSDEEMTGLRGLEDRGVEVTAQDVPMSPAIALRKLQ